MADYRAEVAEEMIRQIEAGTAPWQKPWQPGVIRARPFNPASGKDYRGINSWWLEMQGHGDPRWLTYRQATALDAQVRKGERGTTVEYWQWTRQVPEVDADGNEILGEDGKPRLQTVRLDRPRVFFARVFNAEQIDGLAPLVTPAPEFEPVARAEEILAAGGVSITHDQSDRAFYRPATDRIHLPSKAAFPEAYEYYATALHELGHATGHPSRLARTFGPFGSRDYAVEELRAEMASFLLTTESGLGHYPERHAGYVESWLKVLQDDRNLLFRAARDAETIRSWVLEPERRQALERGAAMENEAAAVPTVEAALAPVAAAAAPAVAADAVALPTLDGDATVTLERGMLRLNRHGGSMSFGGTAVAVRWAVQNQVPDADLTAVLRMVGAAKPLPAPDMIPAAEGKAVALAGPGDFAGRIVDVGDRHILQETPKGLVLHDMAALGYDGASVAALVAAQEAGTTVRLTYDNDGSLGLDVTATMEAARQVGTAFDAARDFAPAPTVSLPTLDGDATVTLERGMLRLNRHGGSMSFGGTAVAVRWAVQNQVPDADLTAVLRMVGAAKPLPAPDMIPAAEGKAVTLAGPGDFAGRIADIGDRHILQETPKGLVLHDMAALGYDGASVAALVAAQEAGTTVRLTYDNDGSLGLDVTATMEAARQAGTAFDAARDFAPAPTVSLPTLDGDATVTLERGMLRLNRHGGSMSFGGTAVAVRWAVQNQVPDADLTAVLRMVGAAKPLPTPDMIPAAEGKAVALAGPGDFAGRIVDIGDRHILQETPKGLVLHDMAAMDFDAAAVAGLVRAQEVGSAVTFGYGPDGGLRSLDSEHHPELQAWRKQGMENGEAAERHYLQVPYPERHAAKAAGARWDKEAKAWYVPEGVDPAAFAKWEKGAATAERQAPETAAERTAAPEKAERVYLAVPYAERNAAKAAGARWDRHRKAWYVGADADPAAVARWQAKEPAVTTAPAVDPVKEFADALKAHGLVVEGAPVMDGRWHRAAVDGDRKGVQSGSYRGFLDGVPNGQIMNYKAGKEAVKWVATGATVDPTERAQMQAQAAARAVLREAERAAAAERGAQVARGLLRAGKPFEAGTPHPYLQRKGIVPMSRLSLKDDTLLVPMVNAGGAVRNVQSIAADGDKRYVAGAEKVGLYHPIDPDRMLGVGPTIIAEGYATAATLHTATGRPVVVAFDAGNLKPVAEALRAKYPSADLIIAADDDHHLEAKNKPNTGIERATAAAELVGARLIRPPLTEAEKAKGRTDFNDLVAERGADAAHAVIQQVVDAALARPPLKPAVKQEQAEEQEKEPPRQELRRHKPRARAAGMAM